MHIITWKKYGILVPILFLAGVMPAEFLLKWTHQNHGRWESLTMFFPGVVLLVLGRALDLKNEPNEFYHLRMMVWGGLFAVFGLVILFTG